MRGRGRKIDRRMRGWKCPNFQTKLEILLCLMDGEKSKSEIRGYLKTALAIYDRSGIDRRLNELEEEGYIVRRREEQHVGKGLPPVYFRLSDKYNTYTGFKALYDYFSIHSKELREKHKVQRDFLLEFQKSLYTQNTINETIFSEMAKDMLKALGYAFCRIAVMNDAEREVDPEFKKILKLLELEIEIEEYNFLTKLFSSREIIQWRDSINKKLEPSIGTPQYNNREELVKSDVNEFIERLDTSHLSLFPLNERTNILQILKFSPSALSFILKLENTEVKQLTVILKAYIHYYMPSYLSCETNYDWQKETDEERKTEKFLALLESIFKSKIIITLGPTPLTMILHSLLVSDIFSGRAVESEWVAGYYITMFFPGMTKPTEAPP